jgi:hypothetical protein
MIPTLESSNLGEDLTSGIEIDSLNEGSKQSMHLHQRKIKNENV